MNLTEAEYQAALREQEVRWFEGVTKYDDNEDVIDRLAHYAKNEPLKYEHLREVGAKHLACRPAVLDKLVLGYGKSEQQANKPLATEQPAKSNADSTLQGSAVLCPDVQLWPDAIDGAAALNDATATLNHYLVLPEGAADAIALWCAHTYCFDLFRHSPRLNVTSPEKACGKSTLRDVVALLVNRPLC